MVRALFIIGYNLPITLLKQFPPKWFLKLQSFEDVLQWGEWPSGLRRCNKNWKVPGSNPLGARPGLGTQPHYEAPGDLRVEYVQMQ